MVLRVKSEQLAAQTRLRLKPKRVELNRIEEGVAGSVCGSGREAMWKDKPPGLKILWVWTLGTAAVLVANVVRTRIKDMDNLMNNTEEHQPQPQPQQETLSLPHSDEAKPQ